MILSFSNSGLRDAAERGDIYKLARLIKSGACVNLASGVSYVLCESVRGRGSLQFLPYMGTIITQLIVFESVREEDMQGRK